MTKPPGGLCLSKPRYGGDRTCRPLPLASDLKLRLTKIGVHVLPSGEDRAAELPEESANNSAARGSVAHRRRHQ